MNQINYDTLHYTKDSIELVIITIVLIQLIILTIGMSKFFDFLNIKNTKYKSLIVIVIIAQISIPIFY